MRTGARGAGIAKDGSRWGIAAYISTKRIEDAGGVAAERRRGDATSPLDVPRGLSPGLNEPNDQTRKECQGRADACRCWPAALFVFAGVVAASIPRC